jgi:uncharacterized protein YjgD (DUF1641 family)
MAHPIVFKPKPVDPQLELMKRVEAAPREHAEALLVAWDTLQTAHDQGLLDLAQGLMGGKDKIASTLAEGVKTPEAIAAIRNGIALAKVLGALDPDLLERLTKGVEQGIAEHKKETEPPSLWKLFRRSTCSDARRGLSFLTSVLTSIGRATRTPLSPTEK